MSYDEERREGRDDPQDKGGGLALWYFQRRGDRYYLRFTRLAIGLFIAFPLFVILLLVLFFLTSSDPSEHNINLNIGTAPPLIFTTPPPLKIAPPRPTPTPRRGANPVNSSSTPTPSPRVNTNE